jgi:hypothetical protein
MTPEARVERAFDLANYARELRRVRHSMQWGKNLKDLVAEEIRVAVAEERKACAELAERMARAGIGEEIAAAIRAR